MIYDFSSQPLALENILVIQEASLVLRKIRGLDKSIWHWCTTPPRPLSPIPRFLRSARKISSGIFFDRLAGCTGHPHLGSLFLFDSHRRLEEFASGSLHMYEIWPPFRSMQVANTFTTVSSTKYCSITSRRRRLCPVWSRGRLQRPGRKPS